jgi:N-acetylglucosamine kinase-like BadF-type ATPase
MNYVIGVDQGGSGTRAVVCSLDGKILGAGNGPGACHVFSGMEAAMAATHIAVSAALSASGRSKGTALIFAAGIPAQVGRRIYPAGQAVEQLGLAKQSRDRQ